jgi:hypothetical protein
VKTLKVDTSKRVRLPDSKPGQVFAYENANGTVILTPVKPDVRVAKVRFEKENGYTVVVSDRPFDEAAVNKALEEFP